MPNALVIHHNDNDGFCAAWLAKRYFDQFETPVEFFETNYGQEPPDVTDKDVYILDFSYPRETLESIKAAARSILVIDHHKTAQTALEGLDYCIFDMEHSGCQLTRKHFGLPGHWLVDYVEDRDLWQWRLDWSREVNAALSSYPKSFDVWDALASRQFPDDLMKEGIVILRYQARLVERACLCAEEVELDGHRIPIVNATNLQSEIGSKLCEGKPFAATFSASVDGSLTYSLRSDENGLDVSEIAKKLGGGGHRRAAGFKRYGGDDRYYHSPGCSYPLGRASQMTDQQYNELLERVKDLETAYHFSRQPGNGSVGRARLLEAEERVAERVEHNK